VTLASKTYSHNKTQNVNTPQFFYSFGQILTEQCV
jgi:hypothetical protein